MSRLELRVPPDIVWLVVAAIMWLASTLTPALAVSDLVRVMLACTAFAAGGALIVAARVSLNRAHTTWLPSRPERATALVTTGVFGVSRNPTYLGMWLVLLGWSIVLADPVALLLTTLFVLYVNRFQVAPEERALRQSMGDEYRNYEERVRRWL